MDIQDLRIGNLMHGNRIHRKETVTVKEISLNGFSYDALNIHEQPYEASCSVNDMEAVKLNKVQLKKLDFEYVEEVSAFCDKNHLIYEQKDESFCFQPFCTNDADCWIEIKFVHELQNLIFDFKNKVKK